MSIGILYCIAFIGGLLTGAVVMYIFITRMNVAGTLKIDHSKTPVQMRLVVENDIVMFKKKRIIFKVDHNANLSQE